MTPEYLTRSEEVALLAAAKRHAHRDPLIAARYQAAFALLIDTGMRRQELALCDVGDLEHAHGCWVARLPNLKRRRRGRDVTERAKLAQRGGLERCDVDAWRVIPVTMEAALTWRYLAADRAPDRPLLQGWRSSGRISPVSIYSAWRRTWERSGLRGGNAPPLKATRKTYAMRLRQSGADVVLIQRMLAHASLRSTQCYLQTDMDEMRDAVKNAAQWLGSQEHRSPWPSMHPTLWGD